MWPWSHQDRIQVTGVFGWPAVPLAVKQAALIAAADLFRLKDAPFGVAGFGEFAVQDPGEPAGHVAGQAVHQRRSGWRLTWPSPRSRRSAAALATYLDRASPGCAPPPTGSAQISPPCAVIVPQTGRLITYAQTFDGETDYYLRAILLVSEGDSASGQDLLDGYLSPAGAQSVNAAVQADPTLGGVVSYAAVIEATAYGLMNWNGVDYLACSLILNIGT